MPGKIGDAGFFETPDDATKREAEKARLEKNLNPHDHQFLCVIFGGQRIEVPLQEFVKKYGSPEQYSKEELTKYVLNTWMKKNLG